MRISKDVARRFLLGRQGLWPGRRWRSPGGTERAMRAMENVQLDPLQVVARAQDLALASRVVGYRTDEWATLTYERRRFFEWGGWLALRPIDELPYFRMVMRRARQYGQMKTFHAAHGPAIDEMRDLLRDGRELSNRDFSMDARRRVDSYRGRKDSALALHYLWRTGEAMVTRRERFERVYARSEAVAPGKFLVEVPEAEAEDHLLLKDVAAAGFSRLAGAGYTLHREIPMSHVVAWRARKLADGELVLNQSFQKVSGTIRSGNRTVPIASGRLRGEEIYIRTNNNEYRGRISGDAIFGTSKNGAEWKATRAGR